MRFTKMHGIGNDYLYINAMEEQVEDPSALSVKLSERHKGAGADGLVLICSSDKADFRMEMYNADGSRGKMCGNAARCIGRYVYERGLTDKKELTLETDSGIRGLVLNAEGGKVRSVCVDMGEPVLIPEKIPVLPGEIYGGRLSVAGKKWEVTCVSIGNPHCVIFCDDPFALNLAEIGPGFEHHKAFPEGVNTEFVRIDSPTLMTMRVWERGSGETLGCGTGACAALVASVVTGRTERSCKLRLKGGDLLVTWKKEDNHVYQEGPAAFVYDAELL